MFIAARGGCGGHGNNFYLSNLMRKPVKAETGGRGEIVNFNLAKFNKHHKALKKLRLCLLFTLAESIMYLLYLTKTSGKKVKIC